MSPLGCCSYLAEHNSLPSQQWHLDLRGVLLVGADDHHNCGLWGEPKGQTPFRRLLDSLDSSSQSVLGKFVGGFCALVGVFTITLPIPIVVNSFAGFYKNTLMRNEVNSKKRERLKSERHKWRKELQESVTRGGISSEEVNKIIRILSTIFTRYPQLTDLVFAPPCCIFWYPDSYPVITLTQAYSRRKLSFRGESTKIWRWQTWLELVTEHSGTSDCSDQSGSRLVC